MAGISMIHSQISSNLAGNIFSSLNGKKYSVFFESMRVTNSEKDGYMYPDVLIVCDEKDFEGYKFDTLLNPSVIFKIISPPTKSIDKGRKLLYNKGIFLPKKYFMIKTPLKKIIL